MPPRLLERAALNPSIPPLVIDPRALSPDHHLLRRLSGSQPTPLAAAVGQIRRAWPTYGALGTAAHPTPTAAAAWSRVCAERWARPAQLGDVRGLVLTGHGETELARLWRVQVVTPYLRALVASHGAETARRVAKELT